MRLNNKGFTLVEMIVVTAIFVVIIMITGSAFKTVLTQTVKLYKSEESNIEGVVGLEMFQHDLEQAGFGLPDSFQTVITYSEAGVAPANQLNDASGIPRPFATIDNANGLSDSSSESGNTYTILNGTDYLSIKATSLGLSAQALSGIGAAQKWTYLNYTSNSSTVQSKPPQNWSGANLNDGDQVIVLHRTFQPGGGVSNQLVSPPSGNYWTSYRAAGFLPAAAAFAPTLPGDTYYIYGVLDNQPSPALRMPFNRVDYMVATLPPNSPLFPKTCAPNTGVLYKAAVAHVQTGTNPTIPAAAGGLIYTPILDCVADMQVVLGWDLADATGNLVSDPTLTGDGQIDTWTNADGSVASSSVSLTSSTYVHDTILTNAGHIKTKLKIIKVYIVAQNGRKDLNYTSPNPINIVDPGSGELSLTRPGGYTLTTNPNMLNYHWKVYRLVVKPKNLISNQQ